MISINHHIKDGTLYVNNTPVEFKYPAYKSIEMNSIVVVLLKPQRTDLFNDNIFGVNSSGAVIWQIQERPNLNLNKRKQPFMNIWVANTGTLMGGDSLGVDFFINPLDGSIEYAGVSK